MAGGSGEHGAGRTDLSDSELLAAQQRLEAKQRANGTTPARRRSATPTSPSPSPSSPTVAPEAGDLLTQIGNAIRKRGGIRTDRKGNVRFRCPSCNDADNTASYHAGKGVWQCFRLPCGEKGGRLDLARRLELEVPTRAPRYTDTLRTWQRIALTAFDWRALVARYGDSTRPGDISRTAGMCSKVYVALCELGQRADTLTPAAATRTLAELAGCNRRALTRRRRDDSKTGALEILRRAGLVKLTEFWLDRTQNQKPTEKDATPAAPKRALANVYQILEPSELFSLKDCTNAPERSFATPSPEPSSGALAQHSVLWRRGGLHRGILAHLEMGASDTRTFRAATGLSRAAVCRALGKLERYGLATRDGRRWVRTDVNLRDVAQHPNFDILHQRAKKQKARHQNERDHFNRSDALVSALSGRSKAELPLQMVSQQQPDRRIGNLAAALAAVMEGPRLPYSTHTTGARAPNERHGYQVG